MERIASFSVDHLLLEPGVYVSRIDRYLLEFNVFIREVTVLDRHVDRRAAEIAVVGKTQMGYATV
jgi:hypothetical protein